MNCTHTKNNGAVCGGSAMTNSTYCFFHNPEISENKKLEARVKGGRNNPVKNEQPLPELEVINRRAVVELLRQTISEVRAGRIDIRIANCVGFLCGQMLKACESAEEEERQAAVNTLFL